MSVNGNVIGEDQEFGAVSYSPDARAAYAKAMLALVRDQKIFATWSLLLRANGQAATGALIGNEQFALGGVSSVRGYFEGDDYGDMGWFGSAELRTPYISTETPIWSGWVPTWLRATILFDASQRYLVEALPNDDPSRILLGTGFGLSANINNHVDTRITVAWPLRNSANT